MANVLNVHSNGVPGANNPNQNPFTMHSYFMHLHSECWAYLPILFTVNTLNKENTSEEHTLLKKQLC